MIENIFRTDGSTVRPRRIIEILKNHYEIILITGANEKLQLNCLIDVDVVNIKLNNKKFWNFKIIPIIIKKKFDVIYCSNDFFGFFSYYLLSKIYKYKIIYEAHSIVSKENAEIKATEIKIKICQILEKFVVKHADYVIALSENTFNFYKKYNKNIELIPVFLDETVFKINKEIETKKYQRQELKLICIIGPFESIFNLNFLEFLYANIDRFDNRIHFVIIGKCDNIIENKKIAYTGYIYSIQEYVNVLSSLDAVLIPSKIATFGPLNKIIEPMSCSLPVFTTPKGLVGLYYVEPNKDIFVFEEYELVNKINDLIFKVELMEKVGQNARIVVEKYYSKTANERKLMEIIEKLKIN